MATIYLKELLPVSVLFEGDFHELASFILRGFAAQAKDTITRARPTIHGVARAYARLFIDIDPDKIEAKLRKLGYDLGATVEWDEDSPQLSDSKS